MSVKRTRQNASQLANKHQCLKSADDPKRVFALIEKSPQSCPSSGQGLDDDAVRSDCGGHHTRRPSRSAPCAR